MINKGRFVGELAILNSTDLQDGEIVDVLWEQSIDSLLDDLSLEEGSIDNDLLDRVEETAYYLTYCRYKAVKEVTPMPTGDAKNEVHNMNRVMSDKLHVAHRKYCQMFNRLVDDERTDGRYLPIPNSFGI